MKTIAVIGAGLSGLVFARTLNADTKVVIFEKSRGFGGRMATRRTLFRSFDSQNKAHHRQPPGCCLRSRVSCEYGTHRRRFSM